MTETPIFIGLLFALQMLYWFVGKRASKGLQEKEEYFLAGKTVPLFPLMMTFLATQVGGGAILGAADEAYHFGWPVIFYPLGMALGLVVLGLGPGRRLKKLGVSTVAEIFEVVYGSPGLRKVASLLSIVSLFMILVAQFLGSAKFLASMGLTNPLLFVGFWAITILYTARGGLKAVISTDLVQALFFCTVFLSTFAFAVYSDTAVLQIQHFASASSKICGWLLMPLLFMIIEQDMGQRCFAGASGKVVSGATILAGLATFIVCTVPVFLGAFARTMGIEVPVGSSVLMTVCAAMTNPWVTALVGAAILAAIISTATSLINAISSNLASDFPWLCRGPRSLQWGTAGISIAAIFFAFSCNSVVDLLIQSYELSVSCLFVPIFFALFWKQGNFMAALLAIIFGATSFFALHFYDPFISRELASLAFSLTGYGIGSLFPKEVSQLSIEN